MNLTLAICFRVNIFTIQKTQFTLNKQYQEIGFEIESKVFKVGQYIGGQDITKFEENFSNLIGVDNTIRCNSGTDTLVLIYSLCRYLHLL